MKRFENYSLITKESVNTFIKKRKKEIHKGNLGHVLIMAGSKGMTGAAILSARGALRAGAGLVTVAIDEELFPIVQVGIPEAICISRENLKDNLAKYDAVAAGPGLGDDEKNVNLIKTILKEHKGVFVLDADGLNIFSRMNIVGTLKESKAKLIITPHPGEASRLLGKSTVKINEDRLASAIELTEVTGAVAVLKGAGTVVATPEGKTYINITGNPGMATGGSGDVLTGVIAALGGQGLDPEVAAKVGVFLHGMAGDMAAESIGEYGLIASDIANMISYAIKEVCKI
ncbi:NAD(P)H-hydrate dehydratase, partial [Anaerovorax odorimutans]|uniref:NAD(P)H-hydrate dehydratase n=1 Tax=Anaerovorax odorimutans TaxID=109327 RepID=UPI0004007675